MKLLARLAPYLFLVGVAAFAQETTAVPIVVAGASQLSTPIQVSDFKVEVNQEPATVALVTPLSGKHLRYVLINDARVHDDWPGGTDQQVHIAKELLTQVISSGSDIGTLVNYGDNVLLDVQNEKDPKKLSSEIRPTESGPTRLYDAVVAAANWLTKQPNSPEERRVAFLVCDGKETGSHVGLADAVKALQRASSPIFIFTPSDVEKRKQGQYLRQLAEESGGQVYFLPPNTKHVTFDGLKRDLADRFLLT